MKKPLTKHLKVFEAIGLLLLLSSWLLDWSSVRKWDDVEARFFRFVTSFQDTEYKYDANNVMTLQFAIDRAAHNRTLDFEDPNSALIAAWESAEVRQQWLRTEMSHLLAADSKINGALETIRRHQLTTNLDVDRLNRLREDGRSRLVDAANVPLSNIADAIPPKEKVSAVQAGDIDRRIAEFSRSALEPINEVANAIAAKKGFASSLYRLVFALGSAILIFVKICEWREKADQETAPKRCTDEQQQISSSMAEAPNRGTDSESLASVAVD